MTADVSIVFGCIPIAFALLSIFFYREKDLISKVWGVFFRLLFFISCFVVGSFVYEEWNVIVGTPDNLGKLIFYIGTWGCLVIGIPLTALTELVIPALYALDLRKKRNE